MSICLSVCLYASISPEIAEIHAQSSPHVLCKLHWPWRRCDKLCASGFIDDVMFAHNGHELATRKKMRIIKVTQQETAAIQGRG